jgi:hypothetical protein
LQRHQYRLLCAALVLQALSSALGFIFTSRNVPYGPAVLVAGGIVAFSALLLLGQWRVRVALWIVLATSGFAAVAQFTPPIELWRLGLVPLELLAIVLCGRALSSRQASTAP